MNASSENNPDNISNDPASIWMLTNGSATRNSALLDAQQLSPFEGNSPVTGPADLTHSFTINQTDIVTWVMNGATYVEAEIPIVYGNVSDGWQAETTLHMPANSTIDIIMTIANDSMDLVSRPEYSTRTTQHPGYCNCNRLMSQLTSLLDGPSDASPRSQVLGSRLRRRFFSICLSDRRAGIPYQSPQSTLPRHNRNARLWLACY
jgi:hypothetical protein